MASWHRYYLTIQTALWRHNYHFYIAFKWNSSKSSNDTEEGSMMPEDKLQQHSGKSCSATSWTLQRSAGKSNSNALNIHHVEVEQYGTRLSLLFMSCWKMAAWIPIIKTLPISHHSKSWVIKLRNVPCGGEQEWNTARSRQETLQITSGNYEEILYSFK